MYVQIYAYVVECIIQDSNINRLLPGVPDTNNSCVTSLINNQTIS